MAESVHFLFTIWTKFFFLFTPFFALSMFLSLTRGHSRAERRRVALHVTGAVGLLCVFLFFFGRMVFSLFGITLDAFRVGAGILLFLSAVGLVQGGGTDAGADAETDISVVPLAMPIIVGPATIGTLLVLGADIGGATERILGCVALLLAVCSVGCVLLLGAAIERRLGRRGIAILSKVTGVVLAALAAEMIMTGIQHRFGL
jgi:multiple antibiotic resistance protein